MYVGEDTALAETARERGVEYLGAREVLTYHAVVETNLRGTVKGAWRWNGLPLLIRRHPRIRDDFILWAFWKRTHVWLPLAAAGAWGMKRSRLAALLIAPYAVHSVPTWHGPHPRGRIRALFEWPGRVAIDVAEMAALLWGSIKHRRPFL
jgi:hypothetical protein